MFVWTAGSSSQFKVSSVLSTLRSSKQTAARCLHINIPASPLVSLCLKHRERQVFVRKVFRYESRSGRGPTQLRPNQSQDEALWCRKWHIDFIGWKPLEAGAGFCTLCFCLERKWRPSQRFLISGDNSSFPTDQPKNPGRQNYWSDCFWATRRPHPQLLSLTVTASGSEAWSHVKPRHYELVCFSSENPFCSVAR